MVKTMNIVTTTTTSRLSDKASPKRKPNSSNHQAQLDNNDNDNDNNNTTKRAKTIKNPKESRHETKPAEETPPRVWVIVSKPSSLSSQTSSWFSSYRRMRSQCNEKTRHHIVEDPVPYPEQTQRMQTNGCAHLDGRERRSTQGLARPSASASAPAPVKWSYALYDQYSGMLSIHGSFSDVVRLLSEEKMQFAVQNGTESKKEGNNNNDGDDHDRDYDRNDDTAGHDNDGKLPRGPVQTLAIGAARSESDLFPLDIVLDSNAPLSKSFVNQEGSCQNKLRFVKPTPNDEVVSFATSCERNNPLVSLYGLGGFFGCHHCGIPTSPRGLSVVVVVVGHVGHVVGHVGHVISSAVLHL